MIISFFFNYNSRITQEYFQAKIGKKVRTLSLAQKKTRVHLVHDETDHDNTANKTLL